MSHPCNSEPETAARQDARRDRGFSIVELLIVLAVASIMTTMALLAMTGHKNAYKTDDQALRLLDMMRMASQRALTHRQITRLEINLTTNEARLIDENTTANGSTDDRVVQTLKLERTSDVRMDMRPANVGVTPPSPANFPPPTFAASVHPSSSGNNVFTMRFRTNGEVFNAGTNAAGAGSTLTSTTIYIWPPQSGTDNARTLRAVRAITVFGTTGTVKYWGYNGTAFVAK